MPLEKLGTLIRNARLARGLTQKRAADNARVSRRQWALLEGGGNVSVVFLGKVLRSLGLSVTFDGEVDQRTPNMAFDLSELAEIANSFAASVDRLRSFILEASLPPSFRGDAAAIDAFIAKHENTLTSDGARRIEEAIGRASSDVMPPRPEPSRSATLREAPRPHRRRQP